MFLKEKIEQLPSSIGVYIFKQKGRYLYIGKSVNIKARVRSHFQNAKFNLKEATIIKNSDQIDYFITDSEFKATILEAKLIKEGHPKYNVIWKDGKSFLYIKITIKDEYPKVYLCRKENDGKSLYFGPFSSVKTTRRIINEIRRIIPFCMEKKLKDKPCFYSKINLCHPCPGEIISKKDGKERRTLRKIYRQNILKVVKLLRGKVDLIINQFNRQMKKKVKEEKFEEAIILRNKIFRLQALKERFFSDEDISFDSNQSEKALKSLLSFLSINFPNLKKLERIECYDVSNLFSEKATASMVVAIKGVIDKSQYRKFKIKNSQKRGDLIMMEEVFKRRFSGRHKWGSPDLIIIDGGKPQVKIIKKVLDDLNINIPLVGIAKNPDRLILGKSNFSTIYFNNNNLGFNLIRLLRDESHRFAHKYHLLLRNKLL